MSWMQQKKDQERMLQEAGGTEPLFLKKIFKQQELFNKFKDASPTDDDSFRQMSRSRMIINYNDLQQELQA